MADGASPISPDSLAPQPGAAASTISARALAQEMVLGMLTIMLIRTSPRMLDDLTGHAYGLHGAPPPPGQPAALRARQKFLDRSIDVGVGLHNACMRANARQCAHKRAKVCQL